MKIPKTFRTEKDLEKKIADLLEDRVELEESVENKDLGFYEHKLSYIARKIAGILGKSCDHPQYKENYVFTDPSIHLMIDYSRTLDPWDSYQDEYKLTIYADNIIVFKEEYVSDKSVLKTFVKGDWIKKLFKIHEGKLSK